MNLKSIPPENMAENMAENVGGVLLIDKPPGCSSFAVVYHVRKKVQVKKVGHAGTLDPFATGLLILLVGSRWTKQAGHFTGLDKSYDVLIELGRSTTTFDPEGETTAESTYQPTLEEVEAALKLFTGEFDQIPPMFSAKKIGGKRLYELARKGHSIERKPVRVRATPRLKKYNYPYIELEVDCSKGTYIRSLAYDLAKSLSAEGYVKELRRTACGPFSITDAMTLQQFLATSHEEQPWPFIELPLFAHQFSQQTLPVLQKSANE